MLGFRVLFKFMNCVWPVQTHAHVFVICISMVTFDLAVMAVVLDFKD